MWEHPVFGKSVISNNNNFYFSTTYFVNSLDIFFKVITQENRLKKTILWKSKNSKQTETIGAVESTEKVWHFCNN